MNTMKVIRSGLRQEATQTVTTAQTVPALESSWPGFEGMPPVFATAMMIGFIEQTCALVVRDLLEDGQGTVGTHVNVSHVAATPVGMRVTAKIELVAVEGRNLDYSVQCFDEIGLIGEGTHRRAVIDSARFLKRVEAKVGVSTASM